MIKRILFLTTTIYLFFQVNHSPALADSGNNKDTALIVEGVYQTAEQFLKQHPAYMPDELYRSQSVTRFSIRAWANKDSLYIVNNQKKKTILREDVWGFYDDGNLFLQRHEYFHKVTLLGSISLFNEIYPLIKAPFTPVTTDATKEIIPGMVDLHTGKMYPFDVKSLTLLLQTDEILLNNYKVLSRKMKKKMMYSYVERFNDRHPLF